MRNKQAKRIRKLIRDNMPSLPERHYEVVNEREKLFPIGFNTDGTTRFYPMMVGTTVLDACQRRAYQKAKKLHHTYHGR